MRTDSSCLFSATRNVDYDLETDRKVPLTRFSFVSAEGGKSVGNTEVATCGLLCLSLLLCPNVRWCGLRK